LPAAHEYEEVVKLRLECSVLERLLDKSHRSFAAHTHINGQADRQRLGPVLGQGFTVVHKASELREEVLDVSSANTGDICHTEEGSEGGGRGGGTNDHHV
jgi:hypothetical protein